MTKDEMVQFALKSDDTAEDTMWHIYQQGRADQKVEDNEFFNFEGAWRLEKQKIRVEVIDEYLKAFCDNDNQSNYRTLNRHSQSWNSYARYIADRLKEKKEKYV